MIPLVRHTGQMSLLDHCPLDFAELDTQAKMDVIDMIFPKRHEGLKDSAHSKELDDWTDVELCRLFEVCTTMEIAAETARAIISEVALTRQEIENRVARRLIESIGLVRNYFRRARGPPPTLASPPILLGWHVPPDQEEPEQPRTD